MNLIKSPQSDKTGDIKRNTYVDNQKTISTDILVTFKNTNNASLLQTTVKGKDDQTIAKLSYSRVTKYSEIKSAANYYTEKKES